MRLPSIFTKNKNNLSAEAGNILSPETIAAYDHLAAFTLGLITEFGTDHGRTGRRYLKLLHGDEKMAARKWTLELAVDYPEVSDPTAQQRYEGKVEYDREADLNKRSIAIDFTKAAAKEDCSDAIFVSNVLFRGASEDMGLVRIDTGKIITDPRHINSLGHHISMAVAATGIEAAPYEPLPLS